MTMQQDVWNYLKGKNLPEKSISAVMGNIYAESGFDPNLVEVGNSIGFGLCQWSFTRRTQLESYGTDLTHQLNFLWSELTGDNRTETGADLQWFDKSPYLTKVDFMNGNGEINDLTSAFCFCWERPNVELAHLDVRQAQALIYYNQFKGSSGGGDTGGGGDDGGGGEENPPIGDVKLKSNHFYGFTDSFLGRKFQSNNKTFTLVKIVGDMAIIKDGEKSRNVPKKNLIDI